MKFNLCLIKPQGYLHSPAFSELAEVVGYGLMDLGHEVGINVNQIFHDARNIVIGGHLLPEGAQGQLPKSSIVINTEQIFADDLSWKSKIINLCKNCTVWDYSLRNIEAFSQAGVNNVHYLRLGHHPKLSRLSKPAEQDIDVLFYGSINLRRKKIIESLQDSGLNVQTLFGVYGPQRDAFVERSKVILNLHHYDSKIFEIVRVFYLMSNKKAVVSEVGPETSIDPVYLDGIVATIYEDLINTCALMVSDDAQRNEIETRAFHAIEQLPQAVILEAVLKEMG